MYSAVRIGNASYYSPLLKDFQILCDEQTYPKLFDSISLLIFGQEKFGPVLQVATATKMLQSQSFPKDCLLVSKKPEEVICNTFESHGYCFPITAEYLSRTVKKRIYYHITGSGNQITTIEFGDSEFRDELHVLEIDWDCFALLDCGGSLGDESSFVFHSKFGFPINPKTYKQKTTTTHPSFVSVTISLDNVCQHCQDFAVSSCVHVVQSQFLAVEELKKIFRQNPFDYKRSSCKPQKPVFPRSAFDTEFQSIFEAVSQIFTGDDSLCTALRISAAATVMKDDKENQKEGRVLDSECTELKRKIMAPEFLGDSNTIRLLSQITCREIIIHRIDRKTSRSFNFSPDIFEPINILSNGHGYNPAVIINGEAVSIYEREKELDKTSGNLSPEGSQIKRSTRSTFVQRNMPVSVLTAHRPGSSSEILSDIVGPTELLHNDETGAIKATQVTVETPDEVQLELNTASEEIVTNVSPIAVTKNTVTVNLQIGDFQPDIVETLQLTEFVENSFKKSDYSNVVLYLNTVCVEMGDILSRSECLLLQNIKIFWNKCCRPTFWKDAVKNFKPKCGKDELKNKSLALSQLNETTSAKQLILKVFEMLNIPDECTKEYIQYRDKIHQEHKERKNQTGLFGLGKKFGERFRKKRDPRDKEAYLEDDARANKSSSKTILAITLPVGIQEEQLDTSHFAVAQGDSILQGSQDNFGILDCPTSQSLSITTDSNFEFNHERKLSSNRDNLDNSSAMRNRVDKLQHSSTVACQEDATLTKTSLLSDSFGSSNSTSETETSGNTSNSSKFGEKHFQELEFDLNVSLMEHLETLSEEGDVCSTPLENSRPEFEVEYAADLEKNETHMANFEEGTADTIQLENQHQGSKDSDISSECSWQTEEELEQSILEDDSSKSSVGIAKQTTSRKQQTTDHSSLVSSHDSESDINFRDGVRALHPSKDVLVYKPSRTFEVVVPAKDVESLYSFKDRSFLRNTWVDEFNDLFEEVNESCSFTSKRGIAYDRSGTSTFARIYGHCYCGMNYNAKVKKEPKPNHKIVFNVRSVGNFKLIQKTHTSRQLRGKRRQKAKKRLRHDLPAKVKLDNDANTSIHRVLHKNFKQRSLRSLQTAKREDVKSLTKFSEMSDDLVAFKHETEELEGKNCKILGYVQKHDLTENKIKIHLYTETSLRLLLSSQKNNKAVLHCDLTGSVISKTGKPVMLFLGVVRTASGDTFPMAQALSQRNREVEIQDIFNNIRADMLVINPGFQNAVAGITCSDFSLPVLKGISSGINGCRLSDYISKAYTILKEGDQIDQDQTVIFICTSHLVHSFTRLLRKHLPQTAEYKTRRDLAIQALVRLQETKDLDEFAKVSEDLCKTFDLEAVADDVVGTSVFHLVTPVDQWISENEPTDEEFAEFESQFDDIDHTTVRAKSPFYKLFLGIRSKVESDHSNDGTKTLEENPYHLKKVVDLLQDYYVQYAPLFSSMLLYTSGRTLDPRITNAQVESEFRTTKVIYHKKKRVPLQNFVREHYQYQKGRITGFFSTLSKPAKPPRTKRLGRKKADINVDDKWKKTKSRKLRHVAKKKPFTPPTLRPDMSQIYKDAIDAVVNKAREQKQQETPTAKPKAQNKTDNSSSLEKYTDIRTNKDFFEFREMVRGRLKMLKEKLTKVDDNFKHVDSTTRERAKDRIKFFISFHEDVLEEMDEDEFMSKLDESTDEIELNLRKQINAICKQFDEDIRRETERSRTCNVPEVNEEVEKSKKMRKEIHDRLKKLNIEVPGLSEILLRDTDIPSEKKAAGSTVKKATGNAVEKITGDAVKNSTENVVNRATGNVKKKATGNVEKKAAENAVKKATRKPLEKPIRSYQFEAAKSKAPARGSFGAFDVAKLRQMDSNQLPETINKNVKTMEHNMASNEQTSMSTASNKNQSKISAFNKGTTVQIPKTRNVMTSIEKNLPERGIRNTGNSCYLNSVMQSLLSLPCVDDSLLPIGLFEFHEIMYNRELNDDEIEEELQNGTTNLLYLLRKKGAWASNVQQDVNELYNRLIDVGEYKDFANLFSFDMEKTLTCVKKGCKEKRKIYEPFGEVDIEPNVDVGTAFHNSVRSKEKLTCNCGDSCTSQEMHCELMPTSAPAALVLRTRVFDHNSPTGKADIASSYVPYTDVLEFPTASGNILYRVHSLVTHTGPDSNSGHYIAYLKHADQWYCFNDTHKEKQGRIPHLQNDEHVYLSIYTRI